MAHPQQAIFDAFARLRTSWPRRGWSWDKRFNCVASSFDVESAPKARELVQEAFPRVWTDRTLATAPPQIRALSERTGGVRSDQILFSADPVLSVIPYGLWWPWGDAKTISLRIGLESPTDWSLKLGEIFGADLQ